MATVTIAVNALTYSYTSQSDPILKDIALSLPQGSRTILVGANGGSHRILFYFRSLSNIELSW